MRYIDVDRLLTIDERLALGATLERIETFVRAVPVQPGPDAPAVLTDLTRYFNHGRLPIECYAMLKRLLGDRNKMWRRLWAPNEDAPRLLVQDLEPLCRTLVSTVSDADWSRTVLNDFFKPFRKPAAGRPAQILPPENAHLIHSFFQTLRRLRNKSSHLGDISSEDVGLMGHLAYLYLVNRFKVELEEKLFTDGDFIEYTDADIPPESEAYDAASRYGRDTVPERYREVARATLAARFAATVLADEPDLASLLPEISSEPPIAPDGVTYLIGDKGSGKTTRLACMMLNEPPRALTLYIVYGNLGMTGTPGTWLSEQFMSGDFASLTPLDHFARLRWLDRAIADGQVAVLFDACAQPRSMLPLISGLMRSFPTVQCIVAAESAGDGSPALEGAALSLMQPPGPETARALMRLITTHTRSGADLTHELVAELDALGVVPASMPPLALTPLLDLLATDNTAASQNYTALTYRLIERLSQRTDIGDDERAELRQNPMFARYDVERATIVALAADVYAALYSGDGRDAAAAIIAGSGYLDDAARRRTFFEHCHLLRADSKVALLATLTAQTMLERPADSTLPRLAPHPALGELAEATATVPYIEPSEADRNAAHPEMVFRPAPRYIASQYILNLLRIYRNQRFTITDRPDHVGSLLVTAAICGTDEVLDELFRPCWLEQWLIPAGQEIPEAGITGAAPSGKDSPLQAMLACLHAHTAFGVRLFDAMSRLNTVGAPPLTRHHLDKTLVSLVAVMTDRRRLELLQALQESAEPDRRELSRVCNRIILQMDVPTATHLYKTDVPLLPPGSLDPIYSKFVQYPHTTPLLLKLTSQLAAQQPARLTRAYETLIAAGAYKGRFGSAFWKLTGELMNRPDCATHITGALRSLPFADLSAPMAMRLYSPHVAEFMLYRRDTLDRRRSKVVPRKLEVPLDTMLGPMSPIPGPGTKINSLSFTVYSRESDRRVLIATEAVPDTVAGRFVRLNGGSYAYVADVVQPIIDNHATAYADITVVLPVAMDLPERGTATLEMTGTSPISMPFIASRGRAGHRAAVLRVDAPDVVATLSGRPEIVGAVVVCGVKARIAEVCIVPFASRQTLLRLTPVYDKSSGKEAPFNVPQSGLITIHYSPHPDERQARGMPIKLLDQSSRCGISSLSSLLGCGTYDDYLLWGAPQPLSRGTLLRHTETGDIYCVEGSYVMANRDFVPAPIISLFYHSLKVARKSGFKMPYFCGVALVIRPLGKACATPVFGEAVPGCFDLHWYQPVVEPTTALWQRDLDPPLSYGILAAKVVPSADGTLRFAVACCSRMTDVRYLRIEGIDMLLPATVGPDGYIDVPSMLRHFVDAGSRVTYYIRLYDADRAPMRMTYDSVAPLLRFGNVNNYPAELRDIVRPYLLRDAESLRLSYRVYAAASVVSEWCRLARSYRGTDFIDPGLRLGVVWMVNDEERRCLILLQPGAADSLEDRPTVRWLDCDNLKVSRNYVVIINGDHIESVAPDVSQWLRRSALGGFRRGIIMHKDKVSTIIADDGSRLPVRKSESSDRISSGTRVTFLIGYSENSGATATHIQKQA